MLRSAFTILSGNAFASLLLLARNLIVARMISVADYGVASTFAVMMAVVEMALALGLQQQIVQAKEGDDPHFQAALQGFQVLRGLFSGAALFFIAGWMADFMGVPDVAWAYKLLALVPLLNALVHFDIYRLNRQMVFWPMLLTGAVPALVSVLVLWPLAHWFGDWRVMLYSIMVQAGLGVVVSHMLAERSYRLVLDRNIMARSLRFGWPLLANAILLFFVFQGDRLIVGRLSGMEALAIFSMGVTLTLTPTLVLAQSLRNFFLPQLSKINSHSPEGPSSFDNLARVTMQAALLSGALTVAAMTILSTPIVYFLLGYKYNDLIPLMVPLAAVSGMRVCKYGPGVVALAVGRTENAMISNLPRVLALPLSWLLLQNGGDLLQIIWLGTAAELLGYGLALALVRGQGVSSLFWAFAIFMVYLALVLMLSIFVSAGHLAGWSVGALVIPMLPLLLLAMPELRDYALRRTHVLW